MKTKIVIPIIVILVGGFIYFSQSGGESIEEYTQLIESSRKEKDDYMKTSSDSPFKSVKEEYTQLNYFSPNLDFKVRAKIEPITTKSFLTLGVSTGEKEKYLKYAYAIFELNGQELRLLLLKKATGKKNEPIFTAFADDTSGKSTYGGGRYIDLAFKNAKKIDIDFNLAYNPYCAYNGDFSCPFPPAENVLSVAIEAGEKPYHD
jgi:uncharacterized protein (DUF1684 family)